MGEKSQVLPCDVARCTGNNCQDKDVCLRFVAGWYDKSCANAPWMDPPGEVDPLTGKTDSYSCDLYTPLEATDVKIICPECGGDGHFLIRGDPNSDEVVVCEGCGGAGYLN